VDSRQRVIQLTFTVDSACEHLDSHAAAARLAWLLAELGAAVNAGEELVERNA
jgi:hypothetical protein